MNSFYWLTISHVPADLHRSPGTPVPPSGFWAGKLSFLFPWVLLKNNSYISSSTWNVSFPFHHVGFSFYLKIAIISVYAFYSKDTTNLCGWDTQVGRYIYVSRSLPGPSVHGILQARILKHVAVPLSRGSSQPRIKPRSPTLQEDSLPSEPPGKPKNIRVGSLSLLQWIFLTQESNWGLLQCRQILYQLSCQRSPWILHTRIVFMGVEIFD